MFDIYHNVKSGQKFEVIIKKRAAKRQKKIVINYCFGFHKEILHITTLPESKLRKFSKFTHCTTQIIIQL